MKTLTEQPSFLFRSSKQPVWLAFLTIPRVAVRTQNFE